MPTTIQALIIVAFVVSPGYILVQVAGGVIPFPRESGDLHVLLPSLTAGIAVHLLMSPWTIRIIDIYLDDNLRDHPEELVLWGGVTAFLVPAVLGIGLGQLSNSSRIDRVLDKIGLGYIDRMPSAWDYVMRFNEPAYVRVYLKGGEVIGGAFSTRSFASTTPDRADLYLEQVWQLDDDGNFVRPLVDNWGVWIAHDTIDRVEFFNSGADEESSDGDTNETGQADTAT